MKVKDLMMRKSPPVTIHSGQSIADAMRLMLDNQISSLVIIDDDDNHVSIITERDIFHLAYRYRGDMMDIKVDGAREESLLVGRLDDEVDTIARTMLENHIRHIPIVDNDETLKGVISIRDIVQAKVE